MIKNNYNPQYVMLTIYQKILNDFFNPHLSVYFILISILFVLLPLTLITGPFLPDLFLSLIGLFFLIISIKNKLYKYYQNIFVYVFALFCVYIIFSGLLSANPKASLILYNGPFFYFRYLFFVLGGWYLLDQNSKLINYFFGILFAVIAVVVIDGFILWLTGVSILGGHTDMKHGGRLTGVFGKEQILGHFLSHVVPLCFALMVFLFKKNKKNTFIIFCFLVISEIFIFITNDRSAFLKITQFTLLLIFLSNHFKLLRLLSFAISIGLIALLLQFSIHSKSRYLNETVDAVSQTKIPYMPWTPGHEAHYKIAFNFFTEKSIIGNGPQFFRYKCEEIKIKGCTSHPHNYYFQTLAELGIVGISFLLIGFIYITYILLRQFINVWFLKNSKYHIPDYLICFYSLAFLFIWPLIPNFSFYNNWINSMVFLPVVFILYFQNKNRLVNFTKP